MATRKHAQPQIVEVAEPERIPVKNPVTGEVFDSIPAMSAEDVNAAVDRARRAQPAWAALSVEARGALLRRWGEAVWDNQKEMIRIIRRESGKNELGAWQEIAVLDAVCAYYAQNASGMLRPQRRTAFVPIKHSVRVYYKPWGVAGFITPWNYPLLLTFIDLIPALIAGNTVILKPSEVTPFTALYAVELMMKVGMPRDVIQVVTGAGRTGAAVVDLVDYISFTGSTAVGKKIAVQAAERLIPCSLELGGKDPFIVLKDADLNLAASEALVGALENSGQACVSTERIYVVEAVYDRFIQRLRHYANQLVIGAGDGLGVHMGSMTNERELIRTEAHIADAVAKGAKVIHGGKRRPDLGPLFFEPTILIDVDHTMDVMTEETFGPLLPVMKVKDAEEAIRLANDSQYGLSGSIFTRNLRRGEQLATRIDCGDICVNTTHWNFGAPSAPMGGVKNSGLGRRGGPEGLMRFVKSQTVLVDNQMLSKPILGHLDDFFFRGAVVLREMRRLIPFLRM
jgi:succinate-semialdehyde dehydrogenase/glutarate-semialdehyde dehydrogenase